jgi:BirA family biotin operon repressor/biotin-[acetyl-CoA-carboxylase] ligase
VTTKRLVLEILEQNRDKGVSGEYIAELLNISRNMIWRAVRDLRADGYVIEAGIKTGYRLTGENDIISVEGMKPFLSSPGLSENITVYSEIDSTNREAKARAINKAAHGTVIVSDCQVCGKGRRNREFFSPPGSGLYMSFVLHSEVLRFTNPTAVTAYAALCVCEAIENACKLKPSIKWVNDIFFNGKKIGGILTEAITVFENGSIGEIILGIGINISTKPQNFPESIRASAGSLYPNGVPLITRNCLSAEIINRILVPAAPKEAELFAQYKKRLFMLGSDIEVIQGEEKYEAEALDIDANGYLVVRTGDGEIKKLSSEEISI